MKRILFIILFSVLVLWGCKKEKIQTELSGIWVEESEAGDTLLFDIPYFSGGGEWFELRREKSLPMLYEFKILEDSISIRNMFSSCLCRETYPFRLQNENRVIVIGDFYGFNESPNTLVRFRKADDF